MPSPVLQPTPLPHIRPLQTMEDAESQLSTQELQLLQSYRTSSLTFKAVAESFLIEEVRLLPRIRFAQGGGGREGGEDGKKETKRDRGKGHFI